MVYNIAIVEDEDIFVNLLQTYLDRYSKEYVVNFDVTRFRNAEEFLKGYRTIWSVVFMDIQLGDMNGMDASIALRKLDKAVSIIFITSMVQFAQKGYEVNAISFLVKPINYYDLQLKLKKALDTSLSMIDHKFEIVLPNGVCSVSTDQLMYVDISNHKLRYHLIGDILEMSGSLSVVEKRLVAHGFLRCNSCYLVNPKHIVSVKGLNVQVGSEVLKISRPKRKSFMLELTNWFSGIRE